MLKKILKQFKVGQKGFTLIELLVVVAILGVLAAVAIPNIAKFVNSGDLSAANTELAVVQTAQAAYMADNNNTATDDLDLLAAYATKAFAGSYGFNMTEGDDSYGKVTAASYKSFTFDATSMIFTK
jgi:type IV pilus assembly protein PilA